MLTTYKIERLRSGRRQIELSLATGIPRQRLSEIECGYITPRADEVERIAAVLGIDAAALLASKVEAA